MADKNRKDSTPPPLLLMPAGGGLTLNPPEQQNRLMPVIQSEASLMSAEFEDLQGEADSFVGQSPEKSQSTPSAFSMFQTPQPSGSDLFSQVGHNPHPSPQTQPQGTPSAPTMFSSQSPFGAPSSTPGGNPLGGTPTGPPTGAQNMFRKQQGTRFNKYAQMPSGTYSGSPGVMNQGQPPSMPPSGSLPPSMPPGGSLPPSMPPGGSLPPSMPPGGSLPPVPPSITPSSSVTMSPFSGGPPVAQVTPTMSSTFPRPQQQFEEKPSFVGMSQGGGPVAMYQPVQSHWCFCKQVENKDIWYPFSLVDSMKLEDALSKGLNTAIIPVNGGRYDVNLSDRTRHAVYWEETPNPVRRCTWFYKREGDNRYVPYEEHFAQRLEDEFKSATTNNSWHKRLEFPGGETIVMHNHNVMVHYQPSAHPDEWGTVQGVTQLVGEGMRPRVVKRGVEDFESIEDGESIQVDHLVFVVHGIGSFCDVKFRNIVECVDDFRSISLSLQQSHYKNFSNRIGRVEFLPVHWHSALHGDATGVDKKLKNITLPSTGKLRHFVNDTLVDILFYTSPTYCQLIADTVGKEMNRLYQMYRTRNPQFQGNVSVAGHSLGSVVLFDLLFHQNDPAAPASTSSSNTEVQGASSDTSQGTSVVASDTSIAEEEVPELSLEDILSKVGLQDKIKIFHDEQIDMESLTMCSESDLKDLGLPMGPRKKLQGLLKEEQQKKQRRQQESERKKKAEIEREMRAKLEEEMKEKQTQQISSRHDLLQRVSSISVDYIQGPQGTGQPSVKYPKLDFSPNAFFALGSPIGVFLSARGIENMGEDYRLPTCSRVFNIFHPFDPVAYRMEPLVNPSAVNIKPLLIPHHKGRKRLHLEFKETMTRVGADIKQKIMDSLKSTWNTINDFAKAHRTSDVTAQSLEEQVDSQMSSVIQNMAVDDDDKQSIASSSYDEDVFMGQLNEGHRIDYVLQERPIESFNDYLFALTSHGCYWESEDTVLLLVKELYSPMGILPQMPGPETTFGYQSAPPMGPPSHMQQIPSMPQPSSIPMSNQQTSVPLMAPSSGFPPAPPPGQGFPSMGYPSSSPSVPQPGPPPMGGFVRGKQS